MERFGRGKCFVISEIGLPGSISRAKADRFLWIIKQAFDAVAEQTGRRIEVERLDADRTVDNFMREVLRRIIRYDLVIAVLSNRNPNAHLELGIALAAGRPTIILVEGPEDMPSDLAGERRICCNLYDPDKAIEELTDTIIARLEQDEPLVAFGKYNAFAKPSHAVRYLNKFLDLSFDEWSKFLWDAQRHLTVATTNFNYLADSRKRFFFSRERLKQRHEAGETASRSGQKFTFLEILLLRAAAEGLQVRLLVLSHDHSFLEHLIHADTESERRLRVEAVKKEMRSNLEMIATALSRGTADPSGMSGFLAEEYPELSFTNFKSGGSFELVPVTRGALYARTCLSEKGAIVTPFHLVEATNSGGPAFQLFNTSFLDDADRNVDNNFYKKVAEDIDVLYQLNKKDAYVLSGERCRQMIGLTA